MTSRRLGRKPLQSEAPAIRTAVGRFVPTVKPLSSTSWDGDAKTTPADVGIIDLSAAFGAPAGIKAVAVRLAIKDETVGVAAGLGRNSNWTVAVSQWTQIANQEIIVSGIVPCDENGDIHFWLSGELDTVYIEIYAYWI